MRVLVGCEFSGVVRDAFIEQGHDAISCDFLPSESDRGPHYQGDVHDMLTSPRQWDLIIMHPDCTCVCNAGNGTYGEGRYGEGTNNLGFIDRLTSAHYTAKLWGKCRVASKRVVFENPPGVLRSMAGLPDPQWVHPWEYGHMEQKKTGLYKTDRTVPDLVPTDIVYFEMMKLPVAEREKVFHMGPSETRWMDRARTYPGIAAAMAEQWGKL